MSDFDPGRLFEEALHMVGASITEVVPAEAQIHLLNAQRELVLAVAAFIEHNSQRSVRSPRAGGKRRKKRRPVPIKVD